MGEREAPEALLTFLICSERQRQGETGTAGQTRMRMEDEVRQIIKAALPGNVTASEQDIDDWLFSVAHARF